MRKLDDECRLQKKDSEWIPLNLFSLNHSFLLFKEGKMGRGKPRLFYSCALDEVHLSLSTGLSFTPLITGVYLGFFCP